MRTRLIMMVLLLGLASDAFAQSQVLEPPSRRDLIDCPVSSYQQYANSDGFWLWTKDRAGVAPVNRAIKGSSLRQISEYFSGPIAGRRYSDRERFNLAQARKVNEAALSLTLYTPAGTLINEVPRSLPNNDYEKLVLPTTEKFEDVIIPCGYVYPFGVTGAKVGANGELELTVTQPNAIQGWAERGVKDPRTGLPGVRVAAAAKPFQPSSGPNAGVNFRVGVIRECGNPLPLMFEVRETVQVEAPPESKPEPARSVPVEKPTRQEMFPEKTPVAELAKPSRPARPAPPDAGFAFTPIVGYRFGEVRSTYTESIPFQGDVPQKHEFGTILVGVEIGPVRRSGFFAEVSGHVRSEAGTMYFQDATSAWIVKKRDTDDSTDDAIRGIGGYRWYFGQATFAGYLGADYWCVCEDYTGQGATTKTERQYRFVVAGFTISTSTPGGRVGLVAGGEYGRGERRSWTQQYYPGIDFPKISHPDQKAESLGFNVRTDVRLIKRVYGFIAYDLKLIDSKRPNTFAADEAVKVSSFTVGLRVRLGK